MRVHETSRRVGTLRRGALGLALLSLIAAAGCSGSEPEKPGTTTGPLVATALRLAAEPDCGATLATLRQQAAAHAGPYGLGTERYSVAADAEDTVKPAAPDGSARQDGADARADAAQKSESGSASDSSGTNVHEAGVDEPDLVKTDGRRLVVLSGGALTVVDVATRRVTGRLTLGQTTGAPLQAVDALLSGDTLLVRADPMMAVYDGKAESSRAIPDTAPGYTPKYAAEQSVLVVVDLTGPPRVAGRLAVDGRVVDSRLVAGVARVVVRSQPRLTFPPSSGPGPDPTVRNRATIARSQLDDWLPRQQVDAAGRTRTATVPCGRLVHPAEFTGSSLTTVYTFDLGRPDDVLGDSGPAGDPMTVAADANVVYGTQSSLYLAGPVPVTGRSSTSTRIFRLTIEGSNRPRQAGAATVDGGLLGQYALSEYSGALRVATTEESSQPQGKLVAPPDAPSTSSTVTVFSTASGGLRRQGRVGGLGRGERIRSVRFLGPVGYVVTFRQTDPLYTIDLSAPDRPRVTGELALTGYSAYLHPAGSGRLLGVGQEATTGGQSLGLQVSLFDVSDPARPRRLARAHLPGAQSEVEWDPHAFLYQPATGMLAVPVSAADGSGLLVLRVGTSRLDEVGTVRAGQQLIRRALVIGSELWTVDDAGVQVVDPSTLAVRARISFV